LQGESSFHEFTAQRRLEFGLDDFSGGRGRDRGIDTVKKPAVPSSRSAIIVCDIQTRQQQFNL
jgi:hypothetical protein